MSKTQSGISLIEMLIAIGIVGLLASLVLLTPPTGDSQRADAMARTLKRAAYISIVSGTPIALAIGPDGQRFERYAHGAWHDLADLPSGLEDRLDLIGGRRGTDGVTRLIFAPGGSASGGQIRYRDIRIEIGRDASVVIAGRTP